MVVDGSIFYFQTKTTKERDKWIGMIQKNIMMSRSRKSIKSNTTSASEDNKD